MVWIPLTVIAVHKKISDHWNADLLRLLGNARRHESTEPDRSLIEGWMKKLWMDLMDGILLHASRDERKAP